MTKKNRGGAVLWNRLSKEAQKIHGDVFCGTLLAYACKFGVNRLRIDGFDKNRYNGQIGNCSLSAQADTIIAVAVVV